jgi:hypothetical protein
MGGLDGTEYQCNHKRLSLEKRERDASQKSVLDVDG